MWAWIATLHRDVCSIDCQYKFIQEGLISFDLRLHLEDICSCYTLFDNGNTNREPIAGMSMPMPVYTLNSGTAKVNDITRVESRVDTWECVRTSHIWNL